MHTLTTLELEARLATPGRPIVIDFWASWCRPCRLLERSMPVVEQDLGGAIDFVKVDIDTAPALAQSLGIWSVPTLLLHHQGRTLATLSGVHSPSTIREWIDKQLNRASEGGHKVVADGGLRHGPDHGTARGD